MAEATQKEAISESVEQEIKPNKPWKRQNGESTLWYNRFNRYRNLGYKRSLEAAWKQEQQTVKALESTNTPEKPKPQRKVTKRVTLVEVPKPKPQVPGSWKKASIQWRWVERARAYDEYIIDSLVESHIDDILQDAAIGIERVKILKNLLNVLQVKYNASHNEMSYEQEIAFFARMQSVLRDIREEMREYDESITRLLVRKTAEDVYANASPDELKAGRIEVKRPL